MPAMGQTNVFGNISGSSGDKLIVYFCLRRFFKRLNQINYGITDTGTEINHFVNRAFVLAIQRG